MHVPLWLVLTIYTLISYFLLTRFSLHSSVTSLYDYVFSENGLVAYKNGELIAKQVSLSKTDFSCNSLTPPPPALPDVLAPPPLAPAPSYSPLLWCSWARYLLTVS